jgi:GTPase SAR1 family protein
MAREGSMLDNTKLNVDLGHIQRTLERLTAGERGKALVAKACRELDATPTAVLWQSLFSDCLRVAYTAVNADNQIDDKELAALYEFVFSVARRYANVLPSYREFAAIDEESIRQFLDHYAKDSGPFGERATHHWPGLTLCREAAKLDEPEPLARYERMMSWLVPAACEIGGVSENDPKWGSKVAEIHAMRKRVATEAAAATASKPAIDPRLKVFLSTTGVFAGVQQANAVFEVDPFDVEKIHPEARASFQALVERAIAPDRHPNRGRMLLVLGDSGSGKTHLLRGFRRHVHEYARGFVAYAQMSSATDNYPRYLLQHVVDSLSRPYSGPFGSRTGLHELASGLARLVSEPLRTQIVELANGEWEGSANLRQHVNQLAEALLASGNKLAVFDPDLIRVLLYSLYPDQRVTARAYKYLRCEDIPPDDRSWIGGLTPSAEDGKPLQMIRDLAQLAFLTRKAALVLMLDQAELSGFNATTTIGAFRRAVDTVYSVVSEVPSAIAVIACISDIYAEVRPQIGTSIIDRLEKDPPVERLQLHRTYSEIEALVGRRLWWLYGQANVDYQSQEPIFPIPADELRKLTNRRTRDVLQWCHQFHLRCVAAKKIVAFQDTVVEKSTEFTINNEGDLNQIAAAWNEACHASGIEVPVTDAGVLDAIAGAAQAVADELGMSLVAQPRKSEGVRVKLVGRAEHASFLLGITNNNYHAGSFSKQIEALAKAAKKDIPVAIRTLAFPSGPASQRTVTELLNHGGRRAYVDSSTLRTLVAFQKFKPSVAPARFLEWQRRDRPLSSLPPMNDLFDLQRLLREPSPTAAPSDEMSAAYANRTPTPPNGTPVARTPANGTPVAVAVAVAVADPVPPSLPIKRAPAAAKRAARKPSPSPIVAPANKLDTKLLLGRTASVGGRVSTIELDSLLRHTGVLGSSGSGKTTLALNLIEQILERDVAVILVDRKGDLAGYAKPDWWQRTADPERARKLADRLDVRLFTPGTDGGRPLALSVVPDLAQVPSHEHKRAVQFAAEALANLLDSTNGTLHAILIQAITVLAEHGEAAGLDALIDLIDSRDDRLLDGAKFEDRHFKKLGEQLNAVKIHHGDLFDADAEQLTIETLIGRNADRKVPLTIISTKFLGDLDRVQSWVAHLIGCLARFAARAPSATLHTVFMIDEADVFMPATSKPPSKEPLQDLLKRARSAGLGVMLASQSPGDFDYRSREQINTWMLGKIADNRSIDKMAPLFEQKPSVGGKLGSQELGRFVVIQDGAISDLERTPSLLRTEQLSEDELQKLAADNRETS